MKRCAYPWVFRNGRYEVCGTLNPKMYSFGSFSMCRGHMNRWLDREEDQPLRDGVTTYLVERGGMVKIGRTIRLNERMASLRNGGCKMPDGMVVGPLRLLATIEADVEQRLHSAFARYRVAGEWFRNEGALAEFITALDGPVFPAHIKPRVTNLQEVLYLHGAI